VLGFFVERDEPMTRIDEVCDDTYRICSMVPDLPVSYNQFLIDDDRPALIHTGFHEMYSDVRSALSKVLDPSSLKYVIILHFEADECGGMSRFVADSTGAKLVCSELSDELNISHWDFSGPVHPVRDGDVLDLGRHRLRFLETPHVHHWDSMMVYDETTDSLFPSDLFIQPGEQPSVIDQDLGDEMCELYRGAGIFAHEQPVLDVVGRLESLTPDWLHPMHGGSIPDELVPTHIQSLRSQPFAYGGTLFGREVQ
jgi:flavorubredoxin